MTKAEIDAVLERVKTWPLERQEDAAAVLLRFEEMDGVYALSEEEMADLDQADASGVASQAEVEAALDRFRP